MIVFKYIFTHNYLLGKTTSSFMALIKHSFLTHSGSFHADEVTACALLIAFSLVDLDKVERTRDLTVMNSGTYEYICDVGGIYLPDDKRFDHHQQTYKGKLASAGMVLKYLYSINTMSKDLYDLLYYSLVLGVDEHDNGKTDHRKGVCTFSNIVSNFAPIDHNADDQEMLVAFKQAVDFTQKHLTRTIDRFNYVKSCAEVIKKEMKKRSVYLIFNEPLPWLETFFRNKGKQHPAKFILMPTGEYWKIRTIPPSVDKKMKIRQPFPKSWAGLLNDDLSRVSGLPGGIFCHKSRFVSIWKTKEDAIRTVKFLLFGERSDDNKNNI
jgi:uncharacterized UPF0160 family protein